MKRFILAAVLLAGIGMTLSACVQYPDRDGSYAGGSGHDNGMTASYVGGDH